MKLFQWHFVLYLIPLAFLLPMSNVQAAHLLGVTCEAGLDTTPGLAGTVTLNDITHHTNPNINPRIVKLNYKCTQDGLSDGSVSLCFGVDGGSYKPNITSTRYMSQGATDPALPRLAFNMTHSGGSLWGKRKVGTGTEYKTSRTIIGRDIGGPAKTIEGSIDISIAMSGTDNTTATAGTYQNQFTNATLTYVARTNVQTPDCSTEVWRTAIFPFTVKATVIKDCKVTTTGALDFDSVMSGSTPTTTSSSPNLINVTCTNGTPYKIGLSPSNGNVEGMGVMSSSTSADPVYYQLRSTAGIDGKVWGNDNVTSPTASNRVTRDGTGAVQGETVYATVSNTDVKPGTYSDIVTVHVDY